MITVTLALVIGIFGMLLYPAEIAAILNLPVSGTVQFLLIGASWAVIGITHALEKNNKLLQKQIYWSRLTFYQNTSTPIDQFRNYKFEEGDSPTEEFWVFVALLIIIICGVGGLLNFGVFGDVGKGWLSPFIAQLHHQ